MDVESRIHKVEEKKMVPNHPCALSCPGHGHFSEGSGIKSSHCLLPQTVHHHLLLDSSQHRECRSIVIRPHFRINQRKPEKVPSPSSPPPFFLLLPVPLFLSPPPQDFFFGLVSGIEVSPQCGDVGGSGTCKRGGD